MSNSTNELVVGHPDLGRSPLDATFTEVIENEFVVGFEDFVGVPGTRSRLV